MRDTPDFLPSPYRYPALWIGGLYLRKEKSFGRACSHARIPGPEKARHRAGVPPAAFLLFVPVGVWSFWATVT